MLLAVIGFLVLVICDEGLAVPYKLNVVKVYNYYAV